MANFSSSLSIAVASELLQICSSIVELDLGLGCRLEYCPLRAMPSVSVVACGFVDAGLVDASLLCVLLQLARLTVRASVLVGRAFGSAGAFTPLAAELTAASDFAATCCDFAIANCCEKGRW